MIEHQGIIQAVVGGNEQAFHSLYELYSTSVYNTALSYLQDTNDAQEVTQEVFIKIYRKANTFRADASVSTWIYRITINTALNHIKRKKRFSLFKSEKPLPDKTDFNHPGVLLENKENARELFATINTLSDQQKTAFILSYVEDLPRQEVAEIMRLSLKAVESSLQRAKKNLRNKLAQAYPNRIKNN